MRNERVRRFQLVLFKNKFLKKIGTSISLLLMRLIKFLFRNDPNILSLYVVRLPDKEDFFPAVSELDLRVVVKNHQHIRSITRQLRFLDRFYPIVTIRSRIFTLAEFKSKYDKSAFYTLRFYQAKKSWTKILGEDVLEQFSKPTEDKILFGLFTDLRHWTYYYMNQLLHHAKKFRSTHYRNIVYFNAYTQLMRTYFKLKAPSEQPGLVEVLSLVEEEITDSGILALNAEIKKIYKSNFLSKFRDDLSFTEEWFRAVKFIHDHFKKRSDLSTQVLETIRNQETYIRLGSVTQILPSRKTINIPRFELKLYDFNLNQRIIVYDLEAIHGMNTMQWRQLLWGILMLKNAHDYNETFVYFKKHDLYFLFDQVSANDSILGLFSPLVAPELKNATGESNTQKMGALFKTYFNYVFKEKDHLKEILLSKKISDQSFAIKCIKLLQIMCMEKAMSEEVVPQLLTFEEITNASLKNGYIQEEDIKWLAKALKSYGNTYAKHKALVDQIFS